MEQWLNYNKANHKTRAGNYRRIFIRVLPLLDFLMKIKNYILRYILTTQTWVLMILWKKRFKNPVGKEKMLITSIFSIFNKVFFAGNQHFLLLPQYFPHF